MSRRCRGLKAEDGRTIWSSAGPVGETKRRNNGPVRRAPVAPRVGHFLMTKTSPSPQQCTLLTPRPNICHRRPSRGKFLSVRNTGQTPGARLVFVMILDSSRGDIMAGCDPVPAPAHPVPQSVPLRARCE
ncbi:hypothetical protein Bbelb_374810 [Branchiostoma belcheri]|nr:hypothetical protein Bbelb_374810 [Branchiostoma belcheri]